MRPNIFVHSVLSTEDAVPAHVLVARDTSDKSIKVHNRLGHRLGGENPSQAGDENGSQGRRFQYIILEAFNTLLKKELYLFFT